ncbi:MAG TPA: tetratricopeptide repeat protein [Caulobacteraceae bacterium]|jgi:tetratricopeptide (TPR) repeat protein
MFRRIVAGIATGFIAGCFVPACALAQADGGPAAAAPPPIAVAPPPPADPLNCPPLTDKEIKRRYPLSGVAMDQGTDLLDKKRPDEAIVYLDRSLCLQPSAIAWQNRGAARIDQHRYADAVADLQRALELEPGRDDARVNLARALSDLRNYKQALAIFDELLARKPHFQAALQNRSSARQRSGDFAGSIADLQTLISLTRDREAARRAGFYVDIAGDWVFAKDYDKAIDAANQALATDPTDADALRMRGYAKSKLGQTDAAIEDYTAAITLDPHFKKAFGNRGEAHLAKKEYDLAIADFSQEIALSPDTTGYIHRATAYDAKGDGDLALADLDMAVKLNGHDGLARASQVFFKIKHGDLNGALADADAIVGIWPNDINAYELRTQVLRQRKEYDRALGDIDHALTLSAKSPQLLTDRCWFGLLSGHDLPRALADCEAALAIRADFTAALDARARVLLRMGRFDDAVAGFDQVLKAAPQTWDALYARGLAKLARGDQAGGEADVAAAKAGDPAVAKNAEEFGVYGQTAR